MPKFEPVAQEPKIAANLELDLAVFSVLLGRIFDMICQFALLRTPRSKCKLLVFFSGWMLLNEVEGGRRLVVIQTY